MERKTKLVIEDNTIYEIDLDCMKEKEQRKKKQMMSQERRMQSNKDKKRAGE